MDRRFVGDAARDGFLQSPTVPMRRSFAVLLFSLLLPLAAPAQVTAAWVRRYDNGQTNGEKPSDIAVDAAGNVYVTGESQNAAGNDDFLTIKYNTDGVELWQVRHDESGNGDGAYALAIDAAGNVYVTGSTNPAHNADFLTIKYDGGGNRIWTARYDAAGTGGEAARAIAVDATGAVYVTGYSNDNSNWYYVTIKYDASGNQVWVARYDAGSHPIAIAVDAGGNVFVTGRPATVKYDPNGVELWARPLNNAGASALAVDAAGNAYVAGNTSDGSGDRDYLTIKYDPAGNVLWQQQWNVGQSDGAAAIGLSQNYVYVTGAAGNSTGPLQHTPATLQYTTDGTLRWARALNPWRGAASALTTDGAANVYITGAVVGQNGDPDFVTAKYNSAGNLRWTVRYHFVRQDHTVGIALDPPGNVYVTGESEGPHLPDGTDQDDYATIKYVESGFSFGRFCWPWGEDPFGRRWPDFLRCLLLPILIIVPVIIFTGIIIRQRRNSRRLRRPNDSVGRATDF